jgi:hypothetical protein
VITHCNTGALATAGHGTALGIIREAYKRGKIKKVFVDETRPYLQGARLTAWELAEEKIPHELITDSMAAHFMKTEKVDAVFVGCDRVARNGDTANKIGTYGLAVAAKYHKVPFYVAMPLSTLDTNIKTGRDIPIEERSSDEVTNIAKVRMAPAATRARHPAFDVINDLFWVLKKWIFIGEDNDIRMGARDLSHRGSLPPITFSTGSKDVDDLAPRNLEREDRGIELFERIWCHRIVNKDIGIHMVRHELHPSWDTQDTGEGLLGGSKINLKEVSYSKGCKRVLDIEESRNIEMEPGIADKKLGALEIEGNVTSDEIGLFLFGTVGHDLARTSTDEILWLLHIEIDHRLFGSGK